MNNKFALIRFACIGLVLIIYQSLELNQALLFFEPLLSTHNFLATIFILNLATLKKKGKKNRWVLIGLIILTVFITWYQLFNILVYFGIHLILTDVYIHRFLDIKESKLMNIIRVPFTTLSYLYLIRLSPLISKYLPENTELILYGALVALVVMIFISLKRKELFPVYDIPVVLVIIYSSFTGLHFDPTSVIMYHLFLWFFIPILKDSKKAILPCSLHFIFFGFFLIFPFSYEIFNQSTCTGRECVNFLAYLHITISFASSRLNPNLIQKLTGFSSTSVKSS